MNFDSFLSAIILVILSYVMFVIGKLVNDILHKEYQLTEELVHKDNPALAIAITGYYFGVILCIGGALTGPSYGLKDDIINLLIYGGLGIILLNISWFLCGKLILYKFKISDELIRDQNQGTGAVSCGMSIASGLIIYGSISGEGGNILTAIAFWAIGQMILTIAGWLYARILDYDIHKEIEKDNVAAGVSFGGALTSMGIVVGLAAEKDFHSWSTDLPNFIIISVLGLVLLPFIRMLSDKVLLPTVKLTDEIAHQETPNIGAAYIEAFSYIAGAFIICWCV